MPDELPYQQANQVRQLLNVRANAEAYGQTTQVEAADKQLAQLGYKTQRQAEKAAAASEERAAAAAAEAATEEEARAAEPKGRTARQQQQTATTAGPGKAPAAESGKK